ncbi:putative DNA modification/repair radical SAM protein [Sandaracinus amylolyticus]|uniref:Biotin synthase related domain containing protein n=1 Tax=Sandaracinus amylolyticus TaxID=927083 RepID=A0A0F6SEV3_9BACT|nr:putative DNA modification/repair radical SAM protein [Sandaracinus amylolyticus]AKF05844.1 Biotin synthase related domain containing protein [Sandaracinus amylolyticus]
METRRKLAILADAAKYDASCASSGASGTREGKVGGVAPSGICHSRTPDGRCVSLLRVLLTNHCIWDCRYCVNRASSDVPRATFEIDEVVALTLDFHRRNLVEGLFLSSGVLKSADHTMERMVEVARRLREDHGFRGYVHLKVVPGASEALLLRAGAYADRVSCNVELPTEGDLAKLAPEKRHDVIETAMSTVRDHVDAAKDDARAPAFAPAGQSTQMIVGATPAPDRAVLVTADRLYREQRLRRVYYTAYSPIPHPDARLPSRAAPRMREHRLYQADWLLRFYGFALDEIVPPEQADLELAIDPKLAWALRHREVFPIDVNVAPRELLLRVPGLGRRVVDRMIGARRHRTLRWEDLGALKVPARARPFVRTAEGADVASRWLDRVDLRARIAKDEPEQLSLFEGRA